MGGDAVPQRSIAPRKIAMSARVTIELFGNGALAKTSERLAEGNGQYVENWIHVLAEVERLHGRRYEF